ncbi:MAG: Fur family transcriptional regulator [Betaproteobacteria bacterium]|jgi:Fur family ferric uptake transcriptional regulator
MERNTRQRAAILDALSRAGRPLLPREILQSAQRALPGLGIATVYRNLKALLAEGRLNAVALPAENARFEMSGGRHHHHFQCTRCQRVFDVDACPGDLAALAPPGFAVEDHDLILYGRCKECVPRGAAKTSRRVAAHAQRTPRERPNKPSSTGLRSESGRS